jgi:hypothetical protein
MIQSTGCTSDRYTRRAHEAVLVAARADHDFGGWPAGVLASVAGDLGSSWALMAGWPGSREADLVKQLVKRTVRWDDDVLAEYKERGR